MKPTKAWFDYLGKCFFLIPLMSLGCTDSGINDRDTSGNPPQGNNTDNTYGTDTTGYSDGDADGDADADADGDADADADGDADADTDADTDGTDTEEKVCDEKNFEISGKMVDILIVLDRSLSMEESQLWIPMGSALTEVTALTEANVNYGLMTFPFTDEECSPGDIQIDIAPENAANIADVVGGGPNDVGCSLGTPTADTLSLAKTYLSGIDDGLEKYVLLANDGAPNCNDSLSPSTCRCSVNLGGMGSCPAQWCLDDEDTINAATELYEAGFPVYVLGIGDSMQWDDVMNAIAYAGGTGQYIPADSDQLTSTLKNIVGDIMSCDFEVDWDSLAGNALKMPDKVNFYCKQDINEPSNPDPTTGNVIPMNPDCAAGAWGWTWTDDTATTIRMCEESCDAIKKGQCPVVSATFGCATIVPV